MNPLAMVQAFGSAGAQSVKLVNHRNEEKTSPRKTRLLKRIKPDAEDTEPAAELAPKQAAVVLRKRLAELKPHQFLDVTAFDVVTGKGARALPKPPANVKTHVLAPTVALGARTQVQLESVLALL